MPEAALPVSAATARGVLNGVSSLLKRCQSLQDRGMPSATDEPLRFGRFEIRPAERALLVDGAQRRRRRARLRPAAGAGAAARAHGQASRSCSTSCGLVSSSRNTTSQRTSAACARLLGAQVIATVPGRGYQFVAKPDARRLRGPLPRGRRAHNLPEQRTRFIGRDGRTGRPRRASCRSRDS